MYYQFYGQNGTTVAVVQITDVNDNHPQFQHTKYQFFAMEETENVFIGQVKVLPLFQSISININICSSSFSTCCK